TNFETAKMAMAQPEPFRRRRECGWAAMVSVCLTVAAVAEPALAASETRPQVRVRTGVLQGVTESGADVVAYKGIPYAKPPTGELRWRPPVQPQAWDGVRDAKAFGYACLQPPSQPTSLYYGGMA